MPPLLGTIQDPLPAAELAKKMAASWAAFAATGKPDLPGLAWAPTDPETNKTMVWDNECRMVNDPQHEARLAMEKVLKLSRVGRFVSWP